MSDSFEDDSTDFTAQPASQNAPSTPSLEPVNEEPAHGTNTSPKAKSTAESRGVPTDDDFASLLAGLNVDPVTTGSKPEEVDSATPGSSAAAAASPSISSGGSSTDAFPYKAPSVSAPGTSPTTDTGFASSLPSTGSGGALGRRLQPLGGGLGETGRPDQLAPLGRVSGASGGGLAPLRDPLASSTEDESTSKRTGPPLSPNTRRAMGLVRPTLTQTRPGREGKSGDYRHAVHLSVHITGCYVSLTVFLRVVGAIAE